MLQKYLYNPRIILLSIVLFTALLFLNTLHGDFTFLDDDSFVVNNDHIKSLDMTHIKTIFTSREVGHYAPITSLSYAIEYKIAGLNPLIYHITNLLIHLLNVILVFILISKFNRNIFICGLTTLLFAIHPMHVESVAWIAARSTLLYSTFYLLALLSYIKYLNKNDDLKYLIITFFLFTLSLLSKSPAVTLPVLLLGIDWYYKRSFMLKLFIEKLPFLILSILFGIISIIMAKEIGTANIVSSVFSILDRFFLVSYAAMFYIVQAIIPIKLSALHFNPVKQNGLLPTIYYLSIFINLCIGFIVYRIIKLLAEQKSNIVMGLIFFLITISLFLQFYPIGNTIVCERYTYIPYIGLFFIMSLVIHEVIMKYKKLKLTLSILLGLYIVSLSATTYQRNRAWHNNITIWSDIIKKSPTNYYGYYGLACSYFAIADYKNAITQYDSAIAKEPKFSTPYFFKGQALQNTGQHKLAIEAYTQALQYGALNKSEIFNNRSNAYLKLKNSDAALFDIKQIIVLEPKNTKAYNQAGLISQQNKDLQQALIYYSKTLDIDKKNTDAWYNRGNVWYAMEQYKMAWHDYNKALEIQPNDVLYCNRGIARFQLSDKDGACTDWQQAASMGNQKAKQLLLENCKPNE